VEYVRSVFMDVDTVGFFAIDVSTLMRAFVYDQTALSGFLGFVGKCRTEQSSTYY
jgi:hypothetical protein